jgi:methylmalonyl-CoA/ethylmalonyl-CoA epimerase
MTAQDKSPCNARHINHVAIAVRDIDESLALYRRLFGLPEVEVEELEDQAVRAALVTVGGSQLEFIAPTDDDGGVARFISKRGEGLHHVCFEVDGLQGTLDALDKEGVGLIDHAPREGLSGMIGFLHPKSTGGVLVELVDSETARH